MLTWITSTPEKEPDRYMAKAFPVVSVRLLATVSEHLEVFWVIVKITG